MKKSLSVVVVSLAMTLGLASCGGTSSIVNSSEISSENSVQTSVSSENETVSSEAASESSAVQSSETAPVEHRDDFVRAVSESAKTRDYDGRFDTALEDFSGNTLNGAGEIKEPFLRVMVDSNLENFPHDEDGTIYKAGTGTPDLTTEAGIGFRIRVKEGKIGLKNLVLTLRGNDTLATYPVNLGSEDVVDPDGEALPELTDEYQDIVVGLDALGDNVYKNKDGTDSTTKISSALVGFHLYATSEEVSAVLEISEVFFVDKAGNRVAFDQFNRNDVNNVASIGAWWGGSASGFIVRRGLQLKGSSYTTPELGSGYSNLVLSVNGDATGTKLVGLDEKGAQVAEVGWSDLKDADGNAVVSPVNGAYANLAIDLAKSGLSGAKKIQIVSTTELNISAIYETNFEEPVLSKEYPHIGASKAKVLYDFEKTKSAEEIPTAWDTAFDDQLNGIVTYAAGPYMDGHDLVMPATDGYNELTFGSKAAYAGAKYLVFTVKPADGLSLNDFRFSFDAGSATYLNATVAQEGLPTIPTAEDYPYADVNGYEWYIVNLEEAGITNSNGALNLYYTGAVDLHIGSVFLAEDDVPVHELVSKDVAVSEADLSAYAYVGGIDNFDSRYFLFDALGDGTAKFDTFRIEYNGATKFMNKNELAVRTLDGAKVSSDDLIAEEKTTYVVDMTASGFELAAGSTAHLHIGGWSTGKATISRIAAAEHKYVYKVGEGGTAGGDAAGYHYLYGGYASTAITRVYVHVSGNGKETLKDSSLRLQAKDGTDTEVAMVRLDAARRADGAELDTGAVLDETGVDLVIDLPAEIPAGSNLYFHMETVNADGTIVIGTVYGASENTPYSVITAAYTADAVSEK